MIWHKQSAQGFTLLEVMIALVILGVTAAVIVNVLTSAILRSGDREMRFFAVWVAADEIDRMLLQPSMITAGNRQTTRNFANRNWRIDSEIAMADGTQDLWRINIRAQSLSDGKRIQPVLLQTVGRIP